MSPPRSLSSQLSKDDSVRIPAPGELISVEGLDGAGKSTVITALQKQIPTALILREPGGSPLSELLRSILKGAVLPSLHSQPGTSARQLLSQLLETTSNSDLEEVVKSLLANQKPSLRLVRGELTPGDEVTLFNIARAQLMDDIITPHLATRGTIILDRFIDSTVAYQGYGRGLNPDAVRRECLRATAGRVPDLTIYLRVSPDVALARIADRGEADRIESSGDEFFCRVADGFELIAAFEPRIKIVDGEQTPAQVAAEAAKILKSA